MNNSTTNSRYLKTDEKIKNAFFELMKEEGFEEINIKQILERAGISKSTFYVHYQDKYELLDAFENQLLDRFTDSEHTLPINYIRNHSFSKTAELPHVDKTVHTLFHDAEKYAVLLSEKGDSLVFAEKTRKAIYDVWSRLNIKPKNNIPTDYALSVMANASFGLIQEWVHTGCKQSEEEFKRIFTYFVAQIAQSIFEL